MSSAMSAVAIARATGRAASRPSPAARSTMRAMSSRFERQNSAASSRIFGSRPACSSSSSHRRNSQRPSGWAWTAASVSAVSRGGRQRPLAVQLRLGHRAVRGVDAVLQHLGEQLLLRGEVRVEGAAREAGALGDRLDARALQAALDEHLGGRVEQRAARLRLALGAGHACGRPLTCRSVSRYSPVCEADGLRTDRTRGGDGARGAQHLDGRAAARRLGRLARRRLDAGDDGRRLPRRRRRCSRPAWRSSGCSTRRRLAHDRLTGRKQAVTPARAVAALHARRARRLGARRRPTVTPLDRILVVMVVLAVIAFEIWFFVASPSPIAPGRARIRSSLRRVSSRDLFGRRRAAFAPAVDVFYEGDPPRAVVHVELPGVDPDDVTVEVARAASCCSPACAARRRPRAGSTSRSRSSTARSGASSRSAPTSTRPQTQRRLPRRHPRRHAAARARASRARARSRSPSTALVSERAPRPPAARHRSPSPTRSLPLADRPAALDRARQRRAHRRPHDRDGRVEATPSSRSRRPTSCYDVGVVGVDRADDEGARRDAADPRPGRPARARHALGARRRRTSSPRSTRSPTSSRSRPS